MVNTTFFRRASKRNLSERLLTTLAAIFAAISVLPLILVIGYILYKGIAQISPALFFSLPEPPGDDLTSAGGIGNAIVGTILLTTISSSISIPIGVGGGIYLAEYSKDGLFSKFVRFGTNVLAGVPSIIAGVFIYGLIVSSKILFGSTYSAIAGGMALSILMLPTVIKTTEEGLNLVSDDLRKGSLAIGASKFITIIRVTLPAAFKPIATGIVLSISRSCGETAPLIFTALFSFYWSNTSNSLFEPIASLSVLIYNFAIEPYEAQNELAWAASFVLVIFILVTNVLAKLISKQRLKTLSK